MKIVKFLNKLIILVLLLLVPYSTSADQHKMFPFYAGLTGGTTGTLDNIDACNANGKGYDLQDQDMAIGADPSNNRFIVYQFDIDSAASESSPDTIKPDKCDGGTYSGNGRWIFKAPYIKSLDIGLTQNYFLVGNGSNLAAATAPATALSTLETARGDSDWQAYGSMAPTCGSGSTAGSYLRWKVVDSIVYVIFYAICDDSGEADFTFTLPVTTANNGQTIFIPIGVFDNTAQSTAGRLQISPNSTTATLGKDMSAAGGFNTSNQIKKAWGTFFYEK